MQNERCAAAENACKCAGCWLADTGHDSIGTDVATSRPADQLLSAQNQQPQNVGHLPSPTDTCPSKVNKVKESNKGTV